MRFNEKCPPLAVKPTMGKIDLVVTSNESEGKTDLPSGRC